MQSQPFEPERWPKKDDLGAGEKRSRTEESKWASSSKYRCIKKNRKKQSLNDSFYLQRFKLVTWEFLPDMKLQRNAFIILLRLKILLFLFSLQFIHLSVQHLTKLSDKSTFFLLLTIFNRPHPSLSVSLALAPPSRPPPSLYFSPRISHPHHHHLPHPLSAAPFFFRRPLFFKTPNT